MKKIVLFLSIFALGYPISAQKNFTEGFVVTLEGDTIAGMINQKDFNLNYTQCQFKAKNSKEVRTYLPGEISGYGIGGYSSFISEDLSEVEPDRPPKFIEVLVTGPLSLYGFKEHFIFQKDTLPYTVLIGAPVIREQSGVYTNTKANLAHVGILTYLFKECPDIRIAPSRTNVNKDKLIKLTKQYNSCLGYASTTYSKKKQLAKFSPAVYANMGTTKLSYDESINKNGDNFLAGADAVTNSLTQFGFGAGFILPRISDRLMVEIGLNFSSFSYSNVYTSQVPLGNNITGEQTDNVRLEGKLVKIPLAAQYSFLPKSKTTPYLRAGIIFRSVSYTDLGRESEINYQSYHTEDYFDYEISSTSPGLLVAGGVEQKFGKHLGVFVQVQMDKFSNLGAFDRPDEDVETTNLEFRMKRTDTTVGFGLRIY